MTASSKSPWNPDRLDVRAFAQAGAALEAADPLSRYERLAAELPAGVDARGEKVSWWVQGEMRPGVHGAAPSVWLHVRVQIDMPLTCQRCLAPVPTPLRVDRCFRFVADEAAAAAEDEDSEEDVLALEPRPSLRNLIEDELLMELPPVPMHEICPQPLAAGKVHASSDAVEMPPRQHPFAGLARLKK